MKNISNIVIKYCINKKVTTKKELSTNRINLNKFFYLLNLLFIIISKLTVLYCF